MKVARGLLIIGLAGCGFPQAERPWPPKSDPAGRELPQGSPASTTRDAALAQKVVNAKDEPATLIAADRTTCTVTAQRFKEVIVGTKVWCAWR